MSVLSRKKAKVLFFYVREFILFCTFHKD